MKHVEFPRLKVDLVCGCVATLQKNIEDGLDLVSLSACSKHQGYQVPAKVCGFGAYEDWDANRANLRAVSAQKAARMEPEHLYRLGDEFLFVEFQGQVQPLGLTKKVSWLEWEAPKAGAAH